jgi:hypothetical protein
LVNKFWAAIEWDFADKGINALDYFLGVPGRNWDQLIRFYHTFLQVQGSYVWATYMENPDAIDEMLKIPDSEWNKPTAPPLFGWDRLVDRITDLGDQLIAQRASDSRKVKFYPRPKLPVVELRQQRSTGKREDAIEMSRQKNRDRRGV